MTAIVARKNIEIMALKASTVKGNNEVLCQMEGPHVENKALYDKVQKLEAKTEDLVQQFLTNHTTENDRMTMLLCQLSHALPVLSA